MIPQTNIVVPLSSMLHFCVFPIDIVFAFTAQAKVSVELLNMLLIIYLLNIQISQ